jgi:hypothetical protein
MYRPSKRVRESARQREDGGDPESDLEPPEQWQRSHFLPLVIGHLVLNPLRKINALELIHRNRLGRKGPTMQNMQRSTQVTDPREI